LILQVDLISKDIELVNGMSMQGMKKITEFALIYVRW